MSYSGESYALAESFLRDYDVTPPENYRVVADRLAQRIQKGIEDDLEDLVNGGKIREKARPVHGIERAEQKRDGESALKEGARIGMSWDRGTVVLKR